MKKLAHLAALFALVTTGLCGQTNAPGWTAVKALAAGTEVRVAAGGRTVLGKVEQGTDDALVVTHGKDRESLDRQQVTRVLVKKKGHRGRNTLIGLAIGAGAGLGIGLATRAKPDQLKIVSNGAIVAALTAAGAVVGTLVGVLIPSGGWLEIYRK